MNDELEIIEVVGRFEESTSEQVVVARPCDGGTSGLWVRRMTWTLRRQESGDALPWAPHRQPIDVRVSVGGEQKYIISPEWTPIENLLESFELVAPWGLTIGPNATLEFSFRNRSELVCLPIEVTIALHAARRLPNEDELKHMWDAILMAPRLREADSGPEREIVLGSDFELSNEELVVTRRYAFPRALVKRMQALADAADRPIQNEIDQWFDHYTSDHEGRDDEIIPEQIEDWLTASKWTMASWIMSHALGKYGEWEICDTEDEFQEQREVFFGKDAMPEECHAELDRAIGCAFDLDGKGARHHAHEAAKYWWTDEDADV